MDLKLEAAGCTDTGALRMNNEDAYLCCREQGIFVVCDGMGGAAGGEVASRMAAECVSKALCAKTEASRPSDDTLESALIEAIADANRRIYERAQREVEVMGMGTTIVTAQVSTSIAHVAHVGDSRCYLWREGQMELLTQDHSLVGEQVRLGRLSLEEAENSPYRNVITRALGTQLTVMTEYQRIRVQNGDILLLCSDGLTRELNDGEIAAVLARAAGGDKLDDVCQVLVERANAAGGRDNITCVLVRI